MRRISLLIALGCGCLALAWGLFALQGIFVQERDDALDGIGARRRALEQYAHQELQQRLRKRLAEARPTMDAAVDDPLLPASGVWLVDRGRQLLPRTADATSTSASPVSDLYRVLRGPIDSLDDHVEREHSRDPEAPWVQRLSLLVDLRKALGAGDRAAVEGAVRDILAHRARFVISSTLDIPHSVALLAELSDNAKPRKSLMTALLRDGLQGGGTRIEGVQRALLRNRSRFSKVDLAFLKSRIVELSIKAEVVFSDFEARVNEPAGRTLPLPASLDEPMLVNGGTWYVEPPQRERMRGIAIDLPAMLGEISVTMRERSLIGAADHVRGSTDAASASVAALALAIESPDWAPALADVQARYQLKAALEVVVAGLVFGVMILGAVVYRRRQRFLELKGTFVSAVSHELRTPLASIRLMAETLERRTKDLPKAKDYPARIIRDIDALSFLVENILSFNRLQRGRWTAKREKMRVADVVDKLEQERISWARRPAELHSDGVDEVELFADPDLVQLLLTNLIRNACQYTERTPAEIHISAERGDNSWAVSVRDNGVGVPEAEREKIFDDFYRSGGGQKSERGSGLGLAICRKIMEAHGGSIRVADTSSEGTTFELRFPDAASAA